MEGIGAEVAPDALQDHLAGLADAAADDHHLGIQGTAHKTHQLTQIAVDLIEDFESQGVSGLACVKDVLAGQGIGGSQAGVPALCQVLLSQTDDAGGGAVLLGAAPVAAVAGHGFLAVQDQMADFCGGAVGSVEQMAVQDDAAAHAGAQGDKDHVFAALAAALPVFAESGHVGVVTGLHGEACEGLQLPGDVEDAPAQIDAAIDHAPAVHGAGHADTEAQNVLGVDILIQKIAPDRLGDVRENFLTAVLCVCGDLPLVQHGTGFVKISELDGSTAEIDTKSVFHWNHPFRVFIELLYMVQGQIASEPKEIFNRP